MPTFAGLAGAALPDTQPVDGTDISPLLTGEKKIQQVCTTYGTGWVVSVTFDFYPARAERIPLAVINLWSGNPEIGNPDKPVTDFYRPLKLSAPYGRASLPLGCLSYQSSS